MNAIANRPNGTATPTAILPPFERPEEEEDSVWVVGGGGDEGEEIADETRVCDGVMVEERSAAFQFIWMRGACRDAAEPLQLAKVP